VPTTTLIEEQKFNNKNELAALGIKDIFFKYIRFLPYFIISLALALLGAWTYLRYATPTYTSSGSLQIKDEKSSSTSSDQRLNQLVLGEKIRNIQNEIEILRSKPLMVRVVNELNLQTSYHALGKIVTKDIYKRGPFLLDVQQLGDSSRSFTLHVRIVNDKQFTIDGEKPVFSFGEFFTNQFGVMRLIRTPYAAGKEYTVTWEPTQSVAARYAGGVQVSPKPNTSTLLISLESTNPELSADVINRLMVEYGEMTREDKKIEANQTLRYINTTLGLIDHEIDSIQNEDVNLKVKSRLFFPETQAQNYLNDIQKSDQGVFDQSLQSSLAAMLEDYLKDKQNQYSAVPSSLSLGDPTLAGLISSYNHVQIERQSWLNDGVPVNNDHIKLFNNQIETSRINILEALKNMKSSNSLVIQNLKKRGNVAEGEIQTFPKKEKEQARILTRLESKVLLAKFLREQKEITSMSLASAVTSSKIIDQAYVNTTPVKPNRRMIQLMAVLIGLGLPAFIIFMIEVVNDKITTRYDIEKITQAPILGEVGHSYSDNTLVVRKNNRGMVAEQFRIIRSNLQYVLTKIEKPIILVTSSFSGEGKSFVSTNLGAVMALAGKKTIVLEFDIRKPKILKGLGLNKGPGITNYLLGKVEKEQLPIQVTDYDNLYVLSCGPVPPNPSELLLDPKVEELFSYLKQNFDVVLIDTAPVGMVSDAMTLSKFANCTLYIVRQGHTYKKQIGLIDEFYQQGKLPKVSIIINDVKVKPGYGYYGYGRYGYGHGYGYGYQSYYEEEKRPRTFFRKWFGWTGLNGNGITDKEKEKEKQS
jgi:capsular exopolysaccharide synthesis family protein